MRWSWPAFGTGVAFGVLLCLFLLLDGEPDARPEALSIAPAEMTNARTVSATANEDSIARKRPAPAEESSPAEDAVVTTGAADDPAGPPVVEFATERAALTVISGGNWNVVRRDGSDVSFAVATNGSGVEIACLRAPATGEVNRTAAQGLARARAAAEALFAEGRAGAADDLDALLRSSDDGDREAAIGAALRTVPPQIDRLLRVARDAGVGGSLRATALLAATEAAPASPDVTAAVVDLTSDVNLDVRRTAVELLARVGGRGADRAVAILRAGDFAGDLLVPLARTVAASDRALEFLLGHPEPETAFAVLLALHTLADFDVEVAQSASFIPDPVVGEPPATVLARLPDIVRPLLTSADMLVNADRTFGLVAAAGHAAFLRSVAVTPSLPTSIRLAAVNAAVTAPACAEGRASLLAAALADGTSPVEFLRATLQRVPQQDVADGGVRASLLALAETHANAWLREEARAKLQGSPRNAPEDGSLRILSGIYGKDGKTVDVTGVLASMVVGGRLVVEAGNALAGDPLVGIVKDLAVTYTWKGERRTRTIREYEILTLP